MRNKLKNGSIKAVQSNKSVSELPFYRPYFFSLNITAGNPPFSDKNWTHGLQEYDRFDGYGERPPQKNGDYAWLLHVIKSLKRNGKAAVILPHGVLFRGNAEAAIRQSIVDRGLIKGIIGLPPNLFYGTGIPACIIIIDKENADERNGIFMIDASRDFVKDGNKNRLRERDVYKITSVFEQKLELNGYSRFVPLEEIKEKNSYNLNLPRYIDINVREDLQSIEGHLKGGIPAEDIDSQEKYWQAFPKLKQALFKPLREGFYALAVEKDKIRETINNDSDYSAYGDRIETAFNRWKDFADPLLRQIDAATKPKELITQLSGKILEEFESVSLLDKYDAYEVLRSYWNEVMADDVYLLVQEGYQVIRDIEVYKKTSVKKKKDGTETRQEKETGWDGRLVPKSLVIEMFFSGEEKAVEDLEVVITAAQIEVEELIESADEGSVINDVQKENGSVDKQSLKKLLKSKDIDPEDKEILIVMQGLVTKVDEGSKTQKGLLDALDAKVRAQYPKLSEEQCLELLLERKWYRLLLQKVYSLYHTVCQTITDYNSNLTERYEVALPVMESELSNHSKLVKELLLTMGFVW